MAAPHTPLSCGEATAREPLVDPLDTLERLRRRAGSDDPTLEPLLAAVERVVAYWQHARDELDAAWCCYERLLDDELRTRRGLAALLRTVGELAEHDAPEPTHKPEADAPAHEAYAGADERAPVEGATFDLDVRLLGHFELRRHGCVIEGFHGPKTPRVLRYLLANHDRAVARDVLMDLFWSDAAPESARRSLHQTIYLIRRTLRDPAAPDHRYVVHEDEGYSIRASVGLRCDADDFELRAAEGRLADAQDRHEVAAERYEAAAALYRGDYLEDLPYDEWVLARRRHLRVLYLATANRLATLWWGAGRVDDALMLSQRVLDLDPCDEVAHRRAMQCYATLGNRGLMDRQFLACVADMDRLLGVGPTSETIELHEALCNDVPSPGRPPKY